MSAKPAFVVVVVNELVCADSGRNKEDAIEGAKLTDELERCGGMSINA